MSSEHIGRSLFNPVQTSWDASDEHPQCRDVEGRSANQRVAWRCVSHQSSGRQTCSTSACQSSKNIVTWASAVALKGGEVSVASYIMIRY
eukprot:3483212-Amphidinium_carterae.1